MKAPLSLSNRSPIRRLQQLPPAGDVVGLELLNDLLGNRLKVLGRQREDGGSRAGQADAQQAGLRGGRHGLNDLGQAGDQDLAVGLVQLVLHGQVDELRVGRGLAEGDGEEGYPLEVEGLCHKVSMGVVDR